MKYLAFGHRPTLRPALVGLFALASTAACGQSPETTSATTTTTTTTDTGGTDTTTSGGTGGTGGTSTGGGGTGAATTGGGGTGATATGGTGATAGTGGTGGIGGMPTGGTSTGGTSTGGTGTGGTGTGGSGGGTVGNCTADSGPPELVVVGTPGQLLIKGCIVTPDDSFDGEVLIESDILTCVGPTCAAEPGAANASVVVTHGIVLPGLIDAHNHILFDIFDETDWSPSMPYQNHNQWTQEARYGAMVDAKQYMNGEGVPNIDPGFGCEMDKYGELKGIIAGTTSIVGAANPADKTCYGSLARTLDQKPNDLAADKMQVATLFPPSSSSATAICNNILMDVTDAWLVHNGEGIDATSKNEFTTLGNLAAGCLVTQETTVVHGTAYGDAEFTVMADNGMSLVWSPRSNVFLYGAGVDLSKTTDVPLALSKGINVAMGPDWSLGGSQNMLDELRFADVVDNAVWGDLLSAKDIVVMATKNGAHATGLSATLGSLEVGKKADLFVIGGDTTFPWDAVLAATPKDVRLVVVNGMPLYGDDALGALGPAAPGCEALDVCGAPKFVCVAEAGGNATNKFGQTLAEITNILDTELAAYDAMNLSAWDFMPIAPLVKCP